MALAAEAGEQDAATFKVMRSSETTGRPLSICGTPLLEMARIVGDKQVVEWLEVGHAVKSKVRKFSSGYAHRSLCDEAHGGAGFSPPVQRFMAD